MLTRKTLLQFVVLVNLFAAGSGTGLAQAKSQTVVPTQTISLFNGKDLSHFYTWLRNLKYDDPDKVFTVVDNIDGDAVEYFVNGIKVNSGTKGSLREGRILFQSEGAEIFYRNIELHPLRK